jgi:spermidine synthase
MRVLRQALPLLGLGGASLIWQVGSARSLISGLYGNELGLGLVLASWLLLIGLSSALAGLLRPRDPAPLLALCLGLLPLALAVSLGLQHATLPAFTQVGAIVGPGRTLALALLCLALPCSVLGAGFALAARGGELEAGPERNPPEDRPAPAAARVYALECAGTVAAGLVFHLGLARLSLRGVALAAALAPYLCALLLLPTLRRGRGRWLALLGLVAGGLGLAALAGLSLPGAGWLEPRFPGYTVVELRSSPHAALAVLRRGDQTLFLANGQTLFSDQDQERIEGEVHLSLLAHPAPRRILMIGGGLGGGLEEALRHGPSELCYVELDPELVALARRHGGARVGAVLDDPRVRVLYGDGRQIVSAAREAYDVILVGLPGPSSALVNRFYTEEFFALARRALRPGGLIRVSLEGAEGYLSDELARTHATIRAALARSFGGSAALPGGATLLLACREGLDCPRSPAAGAPELAPATLLRRFVARGLEGDRGPSFFNATELQARTLSFRRDLYQERITSVRPARNSDLRPAAYLQSSLLWIAQSSPRLAAALGALARGAERWAWLAAPLALLIGILLAFLPAPFRRGGATRSRAGAALMVAGGVGLALELVLVLASQEIRGVLYLELAAMLTAFMVGLAAGAPLGARLARPARGGGAERSARALRLALLGAAAASLLVLGSLPLALALPSLALPLFLLDLLACGLATGACFAPASALLARRHGTGAPARAYAWDLAGAALGALLGSAVALPVLGLTWTAAACAALCLGLAFGPREEVGV